MGKRWYRGNLAKGILIAVEHIACTGMIVCAIFLAYLYGNSYQLSDARKGHYIQTKGCAKQVEQAADDILCSIRADRMLAEKTADGKRRVLDLVSVENGNYVYKNKSGLAYYVDDLIAWAKKKRGDIQEYEQLYDSDQVLHSGQIVVCRKPDASYHYYKLSDFLQQVEEDELTLLTDPAYGESAEEIRGNVLQLLRNGEYGEDTSIGLKAVADKAGNAAYLQVWNYPSLLPEEECKPVGADSLLDVINDDPNWNGHLTEAINLVNGALDDIGNILADSGKAAQYSEGNTNLYYVYVNPDGKQLYSNIADFGNTYSEKLDYGKALEDVTDRLKNYVLVRPKLADCAATMDTDLQSWQHSIEALNLSGDYVFAVALDSQFSIQDAFAKENSQYQRYARWTHPIPILGCASVICFFVCLIWLTVVAGRRPEDEKIYLNGFDRWYTEFAALAVLLVLGTIIGIGIAISDIFSYRDVWDHGALWIWAVCMGVPLCAAALAGWLGLVRRIKARTLWKNSLLRRLVRLLGRFRRGVSAYLRENARNTVSVWKMLLFMLAFYVLQIAVIIWTSPDVLIFLLFAAEGYAAYRFLRGANDRQKILDGLRRIAGGEMDYKIPLENLRGEPKAEAEYINRIGEGLDAAVEQSLKNERMKTELITNVSHDIKTPLTSIINYIDLLKRENFEDPKVCGYLEILEAKAQRLKVLTEDVVEASKVSTGNISLEMAELNYTEMLNQVLGEFQERFQSGKLRTVAHLPERPVTIYADGRRMWRVLENIFNNVAKYAMEGTRVYVDLREEDGNARFSLKNISAQPLNISADELTERFIRGDVSRSTEGSGLGLSIAKSLVQLQGGEFRLYLDGDLFKVNIDFPMV